MLPRVDLVSTISFFAQLEVVASADIFCDFFVCST
jgi:hypothetical protein